MWQLEVPMMMTSRPGSQPSAAGTVTWASTLPTATGIPAGKPIESAARWVSSPAASPSRPMGPDSF